MNRQDFRVLFLQEITRESWNAVSIFSCCGIPNYLLMLYQSVNVIIFSLLLSFAPMSHYKFCLIVLYKRRFSEFRKYNSILILQLSYYYYSKVVFRLFLTATFFNYFNSHFYIYHHLFSYLHSILDKLNFIQIFMKAIYYIILSKVIFFV